MNDDYVRPNKFWHNDTAIGSDELLSSNACIMYNSVATSITVLTEEQLCARLQVILDNNTVAYGEVVLVQGK